MMKNIDSAKFGMMSIGLGLIVSFCLFVLSLPGIGEGVWPQSEFAVTGLHGSSALCVFGLLLLGCKHRTILSSVLRHPLVLLPFGIGAFSLLFLPFHDLPVRSLLGAPQNGEGPVLWFDWAVLTAGTIVVWRFRFWRLALTATAALAFVVTGAITYAHLRYGFYMTPYVFPDYLAPNLFCAVALMFACFKVRNPFLLVATATLFYTALFLTENQIAIAFGVIGLPFLLGSAWLLRNKQVMQRRFFVLVIGALPVVALAGIFVLLSVMGEDGFYGFDKVVHLRNILSRAYLIWIGVQPLGENPVAFITGTGWGSYTEHLVKYLPTDWYNFIEEDNQWEGVSWDQFHTHDMFVDILFSTGVLGLLLFYAYFLIVPYVVKKSQNLVAVILSAFSVSIMSFWFLFPLNIPYVAIAFGALSKAAPIRRLKRARYSTLIAILLLVAAVQFVAIVVHLLTVQSTHRYDARALSIEQAQSHCPIEYYDGGAGGLHLAKILVSRTRYITAITADEEADKGDIPNQIRKLNHIYCQANDYIRNHPTSNRLLIARLLAQSELLLGVEDLDHQTHEFYIRDWREHVEEWLDKMPARSDQAVPFLLWHLIHQKERDVQEIASAIYARNSNDPVGLWFTGMSMLSTVDQVQTGLSRMRRAVEGGIERYMPVEEDVKSMLFPSK